ncbi:hypothetical protein CBW65_14750 [Tumebacillus avium]|uniref:Barstar (barnase inhibitor) domain-containing protein n=2 Tax=Tumebacillus avium TaxID=1903704 RepID=A0A1Y0ITR0_9BACL|nr:hypothetical protein CBW65_14750 [Tumebacillus avium]
MKGSAARDYDSFFLEIALAFPFPDYFGRNWPALNDCLNDLDWLDADSYLLCIADADQLLLDHEAHLPTFVKYLKKSVKEWVNGRDDEEFPTLPTPFHVVFHCTPEQEQTLRDRLTTANMLIEKTCAL